MKVSGYIPRTVSESQVRDGVKRILGEHGEFKDWGGEPNDLFTSRLALNGKRAAAAFAFKGPATSGKLTPGKLGKNGDQIQRLFGAPAAVFIVQYGGQVAQSVFEEMRTHAYAKAAASPGESIFYCVIDGTDSHRLLLAYPKQFKTASAKKPKRKRK